MGNIGALLGIGIGFLVLRAVAANTRRSSGSRRSRFLLLALPCFLWVKEPPRTVERVAPLALARGAMRDIWSATARRARSYPELMRFLVGRAFYAEAANTIGLFLGDLPRRDQLGFSSEQKDLLLLTGLIAAVVGGIFWGFVVDRIGARDSLMRVLVVWSIALALIAATGFTILPNEALWLIAPLAGFALGGIWASDRPLMIGSPRRNTWDSSTGSMRWPVASPRSSAPFIWALVVDVLGWGRPTALLVLLGLVLVAMVILRPLSSSIGRPDSVPHRDPDAAPS